MNQRAWTDSLVDSLEPEEVSEAIVRRLRARLARGLG